AKLQTPEATPEKYNSPPKVVTGRQPFSSGSESSGYFTPPAEPHLPDLNFDNANEHNVTAQRSATHSENSVASANRFIRSGSTPLPPRHQENFTIIDSNYCESLKSKSAASSHRSVYADTRHESVDYPDSREELDYSKELSEDKTDDVDNLEDRIIEESYLKCEENIIRRESITASLEDLDFIANQAFGERKNLSKSETNIEITPDAKRKTVSSAPALNETNFTNFEKFDDTPVSSTKTSLPGSIVDFQEIEVVKEVIEKSPNKTICKKTITRQLSRKRSCRMPRIERSASQENLRPFTKPKEALGETLNQLDSSEWEVTVKALQNLMRLIKHHSNLIEQNVHAVCVGLGRHIKNLRSQVARSACLTATELFKTLKKALEVDVEELATPLLHRTADTNKFLRSDANDALDEMCTYLSPPKVVTVITSKGVQHQNAIVRCTAIRLLCSLCHRLGPEKVFQLPKDTRDKILVTGANMLMEGSLETRKHAKMMLGHLSTHSQFQRAVLEAVPSQVMRHISKTLKTLT
ncbi:CLASP N terminal, partial [Popillia japonica]